MLDWEKVRRDRIASYDKTLCSNCPGRINSVTGKCVIKNKWIASMKEAETCDEYYNIKQDQMNAQ